MCHGYLCTVLYIYISVNFGVVVLKGIYALLTEGYICQVWCSGIQGIYAQLTW